MPRQRWIWPSIWIDEDFNALSIPARLLFVGMFSLADDHGRGLGSPLNLRAAIFPGDDTVTRADLAKWSTEIKERGMARFYSGGAGDSVFYDIPEWSNWQKPKYPSASKVPAYKGKGRAPGSLREDSGKAPGGFPTERREEGWGEEKRSDQAIGLDRAQPVFADPAEPPDEPQPHRGQDSHFSGSGRRKAKAIAPPIPGREFAAQQAQDRKTRGGGGFSQAAEPRARPPASADAKLKRAILWAQVWNAAENPALRSEHDPRTIAAVEAAGGWDAILASNGTPEYAPTKERFFAALQGQVQRGAQTDAADAEEFGSPPASAAVADGKA